MHTSRLRLEPLEERHANRLFAGLQNEDLYRFISDRPPESVEALAERYRRLATRRAPDGREAWLNWVIVSTSTEHDLGYVQATVHADRSAHIAYVLLREFWGRGYAREAVAAAIAHLRDERAVTAIRATVDTRNRRSIVLLEALGFERGAVRVAAEVIHGKPSDEVEYTLKALR